jgi:YVTN family beta-propeller protein
MSPDGKWLYAIVNSYYTPPLSNTPVQRGELQFFHNIGGTWSLPNLATDQPQSFFYGDIAVGGANLDDEGVTDFPGSVWDPQGLPASPHEFQHYTGGSWTPDTLGGLAVSPTAKQLYVTDQSKNTVAVVDIDPISRAATFVKQIAVGYDPTQIAFSPDGSLAYVTNHGSDSVSVIATSSGKVITTAYLDPVARAPYAIAVSPTGNTIYLGTDYPSDNVTTMSLVAGTA